jgi:hypothetical protein
MNDLAQQTQVENGMLKCLVEGLRNTLAWEVQGNDFARKLSTLRFIAHSFQRHMERLMTLEEHEGYMDVVLETNPNLEKTVEALKQEHDYFRKSIREIIQGLDHVSPSDQATFSRLCGDMAALLKKLDKHDGKEADIVQEAFKREPGGEG